MSLRFQPIGLTGRRVELTARRPVHRAYSSEGEGRTLNIQSLQDSKNTQCSARRTDSKHHSKIYLKDFAEKTDRILEVTIHSGQKFI